jgi:hypothetical protein
MARIKGHIVEIAFGAAVALLALLLAAVEGVG